MNTKEDFIAVFDSGVGGISVLRHLRRVMPGERYLYFGDSANAPYGTKTKDEVEALTFAAARHLMARGVKALVVACNTATSAAIHDLREAYPDTIVIGIEPALKLAYDRYHGGGIGVMATPMTLRVLSRRPCSTGTPPAYSPTEPSMMLAFCRASYASA